jgi:hypothetical protein
MQNGKRNQVVGGPNIKKILDLMAKLVGTHLL